MKNRIIDILTKPIDHVGRDIILPRREAEIIAEKLLNAFGEVAYVCDGKACERCSSEEGFCYHTLDIHHAKNFICIGEGKFAENYVITPLSTQAPDRKPLFTNIDEWSGLQSEYR